MDHHRRDHQAGEVDHLLGATSTPHSYGNSCSHASYNSFEKDEEACNVASEPSKQLTLIGAFKEAWAVSNCPGRLGLVIHALLVVAAVLGLLSLALYIPVMIITDMVGSVGVERV